VRLVFIQATKWIAFIEQRFKRRVDSRYALAQFLNIFTCSTPSRSNTRPIRSSNRCSTPSSVSAALSLISSTAVSNRF